MSAYHKTRRYVLRDCGAGSIWLLHDAQVCRGHMPDDLIDVYQARERAWLDEASKVWLDILRRHPLP